MKVGITGTRNAVTDKQILEVGRFLRSLPEGSQLHHGDCWGADLQGAMMAQGLGIWTVCHPPEKTDLRAFHRSDEVRPATSYRTRNRAIVSEVELLLVVPMQDEWQARGGTWYTHDHAKKKNVPVKIFWPTKET